MKAVSEAEFRKLEAAIGQPLPPLLRAWFISRGKGRFTISLPHLYGDRLIRVGFSETFNFHKRTGKKQNGTAKGTQALFDRIYLGHFTDAHDTGYFYGDCGSAEFKVEEFSAYGEKLADVVPYADFVSGAQPD